MHDTVGKADREKEPGERLDRLIKRMTANIESTNKAYNMVASVRQILVAPPDQQNAKMEGVAPAEPGALNIIEDMVSNQAQRMDALLHELELPSWAYWFREAMRDEHGGLKAIALALVRPYVKPEETLPPYLTRCLICGNEIGADRTHLCKVPADPCGPSGKAKEEPVVCTRCGYTLDPEKNHICETPARTFMCDGRHAYYKRRLRELGMYDDDSDYNGMIGECVEAISELLKGQRHSGGSMYLVMDLLRQLYAEWDGGGIGERPRSEAG